MSMRVILLLPAAAFACAAPPAPAPQEPRELRPAGPEPASAEWLYASEGIKGGRAAECRALTEQLETESSCKGALCSHAASLARDWLRVCNSRTPELVSRVAAVAKGFERRAAQPPAPCEAEAQRLLGKSCNGDADCPKAVQSWATRCADWGTPLVTRMLEVMVARKLGEPMRIDRRGCAELLSDVAKAGACAQKFACQDGLPAIEVYERRCVSAASPRSSTAAVLTLAVRAGAEPEVEPLPMAGADEIDPTLAPLVFEDGKGAVLMSCGKRAGSVDAYLALRRSCTDEEIVMARRFEGPNGPVMRAGRLQHPNDAAFFARFPALRVEGEPGTRYRAALPVFSGALKSAQLAVAPKQAAPGLRGLMLAIEQHVDAVRNSSAFEALLRQEDASLVPLFRALGAAKRKAVHADLSSDRFVSALHRSLAHPLADLDAEGRVKLGATSVAASVELGELLPKSVAAYREELGGRVRLLEKKKLSTAAAHRLAVAADGAASRCGQAMRAFSAAERALLDCAFGVRTCDDSTLEAEAKKADAARRDAAEAWPRAVLALASLEPDQRPGATKAAELAGCREPWW